MKIAIASGKGGTGKTTISTNLAALISEQESVSLIDLDVEEPNSALFIQLEKESESIKYKQVPDWTSDKCTLCGACQSNCNFNAVLQLGNEIILFPELCHSCNACTDLCPTGALKMKDFRIGTLSTFRNDRLSFFEGKLDIGQEQAVPLISQSKKAVSTEKEVGELVIYDAPPGTSCPVIEATKDADLVLLVTEPTPFGLHDLKLAVETMRLLKKKIAVIINRQGIGNEDVNEYCTKEEIPVIAKIPYDRKAAEYYSNGKLIIDAMPEIRKEFEGIVRYLKEQQKIYEPTFSDCK